MYEKTDYKFVAVVNSKIEIPKLMNCLAHITAGLVAKTNDLEMMQFLDYEFQKDTISSSTISPYPFIILKAKNNNQLQTLHQSATVSKIAHNVFTESMLGSSALEQLENTQNSPIEDLTYFGIALFGSVEKIEALTRKFSIFRL